MLIQPHSTTLNKQSTQLLSNFSSGQLLKIKANPGNAIIICHRYYAEIVGPGAAVGGVLDLDCQQVIPMGEVSFVVPSSFQERKQAYLTRQKLIRAMQMVVQNRIPLQRAKITISIVKHYCCAEAFKNLPDEVLAQIAGVLPKTITMARQTLKSNVNKQISQQTYLRKEKNYQSRFNSTPDFIGNLK